MKKRNRWIIIQYRSNGTIPDGYSYLINLYKFNTILQARGYINAPMFMRVRGDCVIIAEHDHKLIMAINNRNHPLAKKLHR